MPQCGQSGACQSISITYTSKNDLSAGEYQNMDIDSILLAVTVMLTATLVVGGVAQKLHLGSIVALLVVGMALGPYSPRPLLTSHVEDLQSVGEIGVMLLLFLVGLDTQPHKLSSL